MSDGGEEADGDSVIFCGERLDDPRTYIVLVGVAYFLVELALFSISRGPSWDESIYLSQVTPGMRALPFVASRSRGILLPVWPVVEFWGSLRAIRLLLAVLSAVALACAFAPWVSVLRFGAPIAAALFCSTWIALVYGSEVMPNLWVAMFAVSSTGLVGRHLMGRDEPWDIPLASLLLALLGVFRPPDVIPVIAAMIIVGVWFRALSVRQIALLVLGVFIGWIPWLVEMSYRFGGLLDALEQARTIGHVTTSAVDSRLIQHLAVIDGPTIGPVSHPHPSLAGIAWWAGLVILTIGGLITAKRTLLFRPLCAATLAGVGFALEYLGFVNGIAPRFLLPSYALLAIPSSWAICLLFGRIRKPLARVLIAAILAVPWTLWQLGTANRIEGQVDASRGALQELGVSLSTLTGDQFCSFASIDSYPQIAYASGCDGHPLTEDSATAIGNLRQAMAPGHKAFVITHSASPPGGPTIETCVPFTLETPQDRHWFIHELPSQSAGRSTCQGGQLHQGSRLVALQRGF